MGGGDLMGWDGLIYSEFNGDTFSVEEFLTVKYAWIEWRAGESD